MNHNINVTVNTEPNKIVAGAVTFYTDGRVIVASDVIADPEARRVLELLADAGFRDAEAEKRGAVKALRDMADEYRFIVMSGGMEWPDVDGWLDERADVIEKGTER